MCSTRVGNPSPKLTGDWKTFPKLLRNWEPPWETKTFLKFHTQSQDEIWQPSKNLPLFTKCHSFKFPLCTENVEIRWGEKFAVEVFFSGLDPLTKPLKPECLSLCNLPCPKRAQFLMLFLKRFHFAPLVSFCFILFMLFWPNQSNAVLQLHLHGNTRLMQNIFIFSGYAGVPVVFLRPRSIELWELCPCQPSLVVVLVDPVT